MSYKTIQTVMFGEDTETTLSTQFLLIQHFKGDPFCSQPYKTTGVSLIDAELSKSGIVRDEHDKVVYFTCDKCKKQFKADKAHGFVVKTDGFISTTWERAYCGRCANKTETLITKLLEAVDEFDDTRPYTSALPVIEKIIKDGKIDPPEELNFKN